MDTTAPLNSRKEAPYKPPLSERFNLRVIGFAAVVLFLLGWPVYTFVRQAMTHGIVDHGNYKAVDLKAMGNFVIENYTTATLNDIPAQYRALDGQKVMLEGQIWAPTEMGDRVHQFELVYSITNCCLGGPPKAQERVFARVSDPKGALRPSGNGFARVTGVLHVTMHREAGAVTRVYELDVERIDQM